MYAIRSYYAQFAVDLMNNQGVKSPELEKANAELRDFLKNKNADQIDTPYVKAVKGLIRVGEAAAGCRYSGVKEENVHFLNLPFYETGQVEKSPASDADVQIVVDLLRKIQPHQIFAAGDLQDPHGTHEVCLQIIFKASYNFV